MQTMPIKVNNEEYLNANEAMKYLGVSRDTFYRFIADQLTPYHSGITRRKHYRKADLDALREMRPGGPGDFEEE